MKTIGLISLGCAKNLVDSENILGLLKSKGYRITNNVETSDIIIINTCGFIDASKKESINTILEMLDYHKKVIVTGCLVERYEKELKEELPEVDAFIPIHKYDEFLKYVSKIDNELHSEEGLNDKYRLISTGNYSAYLKIGEGCSNRCTYCAIPLIRGGFISRPFNDVIEEATLLAEQGYKELIVLQQDTTKYGIDLHNGENIVRLLKELLKIKRLEYIRLLYLYPDEISDELIELIGQEERLTPYFDIPIQHSEDKILKAMNRRGNKEYLFNLFSKIKQRVPKAILRTTVMVGFPGESEEDFSNLLEFIKTVQFDRLGAFTYSREENTPAYDFDNQIDEDIKKKRLATLMKEQQKISYQLNKKHIGEIMRGLVIGQEKGKYLLRSYWNAPDDVDGNIYFSSNQKLKNGDVVKVKITDSSIYDLYGEEVK